MARPQRFLRHGVKRDVKHLITSFFTLKLHTQFRVFRVAPTQLQLGQVADHSVHLEAPPSEITPTQADARANFTLSCEFYAIASQEFNLALRCPPPVAALLPASCSLYLHSLVTYNIATYNIGTYNIVTYNIVTYNILTYNIVTYNIVTCNIVIYNIITYNSNVSP